MHTMQRAAEGPQPNAFSAKTAPFIFSPRVKATPDRLTTRPTGSAHMEARHG